MCGWKGRPGVDLMVGSPGGPVLPCGCILVYTNSSTTLGAFYCESLFAFSSFSFPSLTPCLICGEGEIGDGERRRVKLELRFFLLLVFQLSH